MCQENRLFHDIPISVIRWFVSRMHPRHYEEGEVVFHAGDEGAGAVLLRSGTIEIRNKGTLLATLTSGDIFGEVALIDGKVRTADAVVVASSELVFLLQTDLEEWINHRPKHACIFLKNLGNMLAERLMKANRLVTEQRIEG